MKKIIRRALMFLMFAAVLLGCAAPLRAEQNTTEDTLPPWLSEVHEIISWINTETDLVAFFETDKTIDGAYSVMYGLRLKEFYEQDPRLFISTLAKCSADAQRRSVYLLPRGYDESGPQELQPFYDELLLLMEEDTWSDQEMEVMGQIRSNAEWLLELLQPKPTTEPVIETTLPEETEQEPTVETTVPVYESGEEADPGLYWGIGITALAVLLAAGVYAVIKARKRP